MHKQEILALVAKTVYEHPDWVMDLQYALHVGMTDRMNTETALRARAETALCMVYDAAKNVIPAQHMRTVEEALAHTAMFAGTPFEQSLRCKLGEQDGHRA